ncbi:lipocalin family protein [Dyadobacter subterraneus]|uniref:Lipocalin family protein n=1 Tax=Dyadobacter subterraneus TaxID=2773304 RepID=A0ABR9WLW0_9BACT|nr:lipocalin family protein [Dyadobacter subterraneus]MBE9466059.1 lipocalin family protein [Dyadobacter subterraneus]
MKIFNHLNKTAFFAFFLMFLAFVACKDDDDKTTTPVDNNPIVGKWQLTSVTPETAGTTIPALSLLPALAPCIYELKFTFTSDNKVALSDCDAAVALIGGFIQIQNTTTWKVDSGKLTLTNGTTTSSFGLTQNTNDMQILVNTNTSGTGAAVNAVLSLKRL